MGLITQKGCMLNVWPAEKLHFLSECPLCGSGEKKKVAVRQDGLSIMECLKCGLGYITPKPSSEEIRNYYDESYFTGGKDFFSESDYCRERDLALQKGCVTGYRSIISNVNVRGKTVLEVGCASGSLLSALQKHGPKNLIGIDIAEHPVSYGRSRYGLDLRKSSLIEAKFPSASVDLIIMIDVLEHIDDINSFLAEVKRILSPSGQIFIYTPNYQALAWAGNLWPGLVKDFDHLQYFSRVSLAHASGKIGLMLSKASTSGFPFVMKQYPKGVAGSFRKIFYPKTMLSNLCNKGRFAVASKIHQDIGYDLIAVLSKRPSHGGEYS